MPNFIETDIAVIGGGSAGIAAAVGAGRHTKSCVLIERLDVLGGMGAAALVHTICGLYQKGTEGFANRGFPQEFAKRLLESGGALGPKRMGALDVLLHDPNLFAKLADQITTETRGLSVFKNTELTSVVRETDHWNVQTDTENISAKYLIDTTGDATAVHLAGHPTLREHESKLQRPAYIVKLSDITPSALEESARMQLLHAIVTATRNGSLPEDALGSGIRQTLSPSDAFLTIDLDFQNYDPTSGDQLSIIEAKGRQLAETIATWLRSTVPGFENTQIASYPIRPGIRESRRLHGRHILQEEELVNGTHFPDTIAKTAWPIEMRETARGPKWRHFDQGLIPLSCLVARDDPRLFAAGRCLSASHRALGSLRVMGTCMATGEAAGIAAATLANADAEAPEDLTQLAQTVTDLCQ